MLGYRLNSRGSKTYGPLNKYLIHRASGIPVDLFATTMENKGMAWVVRTGSKAFNVKVMTRLLQLGKKGHAYAGITLADGTTVNCPDEEVVFKELEWEWMPPPMRLEV